MNLWQIQSTLVTLLQAKPQFSGITVLADDGTYPKTPNREAALQGKGLVLIVWQIESDGLIDASKTGVASHVIYCPVVIEENVKINRAAGGSLIEAEKALTYVWEAVLGRPLQSSQVAPVRQFHLLDPPFKNFGRLNGINRIVANFALVQTISPAF